MTVDHAKANTPIYQNDWNRKGLISEMGVKKQVFKVLAEYYQAKKKWEMRS